MALPNRDAGKPRRSPERASEDIDDLDAGGAGAGDDDEGDDEGDGEGGGEGDDGDPPEGGDDQGAEGEGDGEQEGEGEGEGQGDDDEDGGRTIDQISDEEAETRARELGWVPQAEWRGKPELWRPARDFLKRGTANQTTFEKQLDRIFKRNEREAEERKKQFDELNKRVGEQSGLIKTLVERNRKGWDHAFKQGLAEAEEKRARAIEDADIEAVNAADEEIARLKAENEAHQADSPAGDEGEDGDGTEKPGKTDPKAKPQVDPYVRTWVSENPWFDKDIELNAFATALHGRIAKEKPDLTLQENLAEVTRVVRAKFPEKFENPRRQDPGAVNRGGRRQAPGGKPAGKKGRTFNDLPQDAKDACRALQREIPDYTEAEYLRTYEWDA